MEFFFTEILFSFCSRSARLHANNLIRIVARKHVRYIHVASTMSKAFICVKGVNPNRETALCATHERVHCS